MRNPPFDPLEYVRKLEEARINRQQAEIHAEAFQLFEITQEAAIRQDLVTRSDLEHVIAAAASQTRLEIEHTRAELKQEIASVNSNLKQEIASVNNNLKQEIASVNNNLKQEIASVNSNLKQEIASVKSDLHQEIVDVRNELREEFSRGIAETRLEGEHTRANLQQQISGLRSEIIKWMVELLIAQTTLFLAIFGFLASWLRNGLTH